MSAFDLNSLLGGGMADNLLDTLFGGLQTAFDPSSQAAPSNNSNNNNASSSSSSGGGGGPPPPVEQGDPAQRLVRKVVRVSLPAAAAVAAGYRLAPLVDQYFTDKSLRHGGVRFARRFPKFKRTALSPVTRYLFIELYDTLAYILGPTVAETVKQPPVRKALKQALSYAVLFDHAAVGKAAAPGQVPDYIGAMGESWHKLELLTRLYSRFVAAVTQVLMLHGIPMARVPEASEPLRTGILYVPVNRRLEAKALALFHHFSARVQNACTFILHSHMVRDRVLTRFVADAARPHRLPRGLRVDDSAACRRYLNEQLAQGMLPG